MLLITVITVGSPLSRCSRMTIGQASETGQGLTPMVEGGRGCFAGKDGGDLHPQQWPELEHATAASGNDDRAALPFDDESFVRRIRVVTHRRADDTVTLDVRQVRPKRLEHRLRFLW